MKALKELSALHLKFCEGIALKVPRSEAYRAAYPLCSQRAAPSKACRLLKDPLIKAEILRLRKAAEALPGSTVMLLAEKREYLARVKRAKGAKIDETKDADLIQGLKYDRFGNRIIEIPCKLRAIQIDNDLSGDGAEASANKALSGIMALAMELRK